MIFNQKTNDEEHLQEKPKELLVKYRKVVLQVVHQFWQKKVISNSELSVIEEIVFQRLPIRLAKYKDKAANQTYVLTLLVECTQVICSDILDLHLLNQQSPKLILKYIPYISARLDYLVNTNYFKAQDAEDVLQWVQQKLLERLQKGSFQQFESKGETLFRTYLYRIVKNLFTDIYRSLYQTQKNRQQLELKTSLVENKSDLSANPFEVLSGEENLSQQLKRLRQLLQLYALPIRRKFELCLKTSYYLPLRTQEIQRLQVKKEYAQILQTYFGGNYEGMSTVEVWKKLNEFVNLWENKQNNADTLRKWFTRQRNKLLTKLLVLTLVDRELILANKKEEIYGRLLLKVSKDRQVAKYAYEWLGEIVYAFYRNDR